MDKKSLEDRYGKEMLTDNSNIPKCKQCKDCLFRNDGTVYSNDYRKGSCVMFPYPESKPLEVMHSTEACEFYEKEI